MKLLITFFAAFLALVSAEFPEAAPGVVKADIVGPSGSIHSEIPTNGGSFALPVAAPATKVTYLQAPADHYAAQPAVKADIIGPSGSIHSEIPTNSESVLPSTTRVAYSGAPAVYSAVRSALKADIVGPSGSIHSEIPTNSESLAIPVLPSAIRVAYSGAPAVYSASGPTVEADIVGPSGSIHSEIPTNLAGPAVKTDIVGPSGSIHSEIPNNAETVAVAVPPPDVIYSQAPAEYYAEEPVVKTDVIGPTGSIINEITETESVALPAPTPAVSVVYSQAPAVYYAGNPGYIHSEISTNAESVVVPVPNSAAKVVYLQALPKYYPAQATSYIAQPVAKTDVIGPSGSIHSEITTNTESFAVPVSNPAVRVTYLQAPSEYPVPPISYNAEHAVKTDVIGPSGSIHSEIPTNTESVAVPVPNPAVRVAYLQAPSEYPAQPISYIEEPVVENDVIGPSGSIHSEIPSDAVSVAVPSPNPAARVVYLQSPAIYYQQTQPISYAVPHYQNEYQYAYPYPYGIYGGNCFSK